MARPPHHALAQLEVVQAPSDEDAQRGSNVTGERLDEVPFEAHVHLLSFFLAYREDIVERVQGLLNAQRKPIQYLHDRSLLSRDFEECFFTLTGVTHDQRCLKGQLEEVHWSSGFKPRRVEDLHNDLIHPAEMMIRGFYFWQQTRWPGRNGRVRYAHTLFNLYLLRCLELMSMRLWDAGSSRAGDRLAQLQALLDGLWKSSPADQPVLVRDARWLIPLAQSPTTDELAAYFDVAERVAESLTDADRTEVQKAHVRVLGGHLTSQIRHYCLQDGVSINEKSVVLRTRTSNALDFALLIQALSYLLDAYERAIESADTPKRLALAGAICQGISPDPELFLLRVDLLGAYSMIEHLFISIDGDGQVDYTPMGRRHLRLLREYEARIGRLTKALHEDCSHFRPVDGACSPYGVIFGTPSNLTEHMALKTLQRDDVTTFSLEDVFADGDASGGKLAWVNGWRKLPHIDPEVQKLHEYPHPFAAEVFERIEHTLQNCASNGNAKPDFRTGHLYVLADEDLEANSKYSLIPDLPVDFIGSSDKGIVAQQKAEAYDESKLLRDRQEGHFILSFETSGGWLAIKKDMLTEVVGAGQDAKIVGLPAAASGLLRLMCPGMILPECAPHQASVPPSIVKA